jgi:hypothetical protein
MGRGIARVSAAVALVSVAACTGTGGGATGPTGSGSPATVSASVGPSVTPTSTPAAGVVTVWPESPFTATTSREAQERTDAGRARWRLDPEAVAMRFAKTVMGWEVVRLRWAGPQTQGYGEREVAGIQIQQLCPPTAFCPRAILSVQDLVLVQPIRGGDDGIWSVASVRSPELELSFPSQPIARIGEPLPLLVGDRFSVAMDLRGGAHAAAGLRSTDGCQDVSEVQDDIRRPRVTFRVPHEAAFPSSNCEGPVVGYVFAYSAPRLTQLTGDPFLEPATMWAMTVQPVTIAPRA